MRLTQTYEGIANDFLFAFMRTADTEKRVRASAKGLGQRSGDIRARAVGHLVEFDGSHGVDALVRSDDAFQPRLVFWRLHAQCAEGAEDLPEGETPSGVARAGFV